MLANKLLGSKLLASQEEGSWDISTAVFETSFSVSGQETNPNGLFFKPDGSMFFIAGDTANSIHAYTLTDWDLSTAAYSTSVSANSSVPSGVSISPDGTKMLVIDTGLDRLLEFNLASEWDISSATYQRLVSVTTQEGTPTDLFVKPDGTSLFITGSSGDSVYEYSLTPTPWSLQNISYVQSFSFSSTGETTPTALYFKPDGTKMFFLGQGLDRVHEYSLAPAWSIADATYIGYFYVWTQESIPRGLSFSNDGNKMFIVGAGVDSVISYTLS